MHGHRVAEYRNEYAHAGATGGSALRVGNSCSGGQTKVAVVGWVLGLLVGNAPSFYSMPVCPEPAAGLAVGAMVCFAAMLVVALSAAVALWRLPSVRRDVQREWGGVIAGERVRDIKGPGAVAGLLILPVWRPARPPVLLP
jgi:hypothetical protein